MEYTSYEPKIPIQRHPKERKPNKLGIQFLYIQLWPLKGPILLPPRLLHQTRWNRIPCYISERAYVFSLRPQHCSTLLSISGINRSIGNVMNVNPITPQRLDNAKANNQCTYSNNSIPHSIRMSTMTIFSRVAIYTKKATFVATITLQIAHSMNKR